MTSTITIFLWYRKNLVPEKSWNLCRKFAIRKSLGIGIENIWYHEKVLVSVSFKILVPQKVSVSFKILGTVT